VTEPLDSILRQAQELTLLLIVVPLLAAFLLASISRTSELLGRIAGPVVLVASVVMAGQLWLLVQRTATVVVAVGGFPAPLGIVLHADPLGVVFALATALMALLLWPRGGARVREQTLTLLLVAAGSGMALSGDLFNLYVLYEIVAVASYGLAAGHDRGLANVAAVRYLILGAVGSAMALIGIGLIYRATGTLNLAHMAALAPGTLDGPLGLAAFTLLVIGFGVKAELFPVNTWVPEVYATASARVSGLLAGVVSKLALVVLVRVLITVYADTSAHLVLLALGVLGVVSGELAALRANDLWRVLAYSSIGQLGLVAIAFAVPGAPGVMAGLVVALHHLVVKPALFLVAESWGGPLSQLAGAGRRSPWAALLFVVLVLSLIGVPPFPGFWAKYLLLRGALGQSGLFQLAAVAVGVATVVEAAYLFRIVRLLYRADGERALAGRPPAADLVPATVLASVLLVAMFSVAPLGAAVDGIARRASDVGAYVQAVFPAGVPAAFAREAP
jgi:formate hydrogenlyase subunit 3/multisubunit Na+/H+ antiporter MnhD subunit